MATLTIRNLEPQLKSKLRIRAAQHDRSMEEEVRTILKTVLTEEPPSNRNIATMIHGRFSTLGGVELDQVVRESIREPERVDE